METLRLILFFSLAFVLLLLYQAWTEDYGAKPAQTSQQPPSAPVAIESPINTDSPPSPDIPDTPAITTELPPKSASLPAIAAVQAPGDQNIRIITDVLDMEVSTRGGNFLSGLLLDYPVSIDKEDEKFRLLKQNMPNMFVAQSGLIGVEKDKAPTHEAVFQADKMEYVLEEGKDQLDVDLVWTHPSGIKVNKRLTFRRGSYLVEVVQVVTNNSSEPWVGREYRQLLRSPQPESEESSFIYTFTGAAMYSPEEKYEKISFEEIAEQKLSQDVTGGWIAMMQHYFVGAWVPPADSVEHFYTNALPGPKYVIGTYSPAVTVSPGESRSFHSLLFVGPKLQDQLEQVATGLELTVDYGWLTVVSKPLFWLLKKFYELVGNWGWAIILLTILIKLAFYKLSETSYKSMANMRRVTPRIQALKDRYGSDKQRLNQAMMELYKTEKINPLGGCLPILVQIPVFIALYWVLLESVELRDAPFILWIQSLSTKDPYFILPIIMGVSMFIQQKLNPTPPDPMQAKIMMSLPFVFTIFFAFFPAGLVLYWVVNNLLSIAQQWYITRKIEEAAKKV